MTITAASVAKGTGAATTTGTAGATITAGQTVYLDSSDNKYKLADANASSTTQLVVGIALHASANGQPLTILTAGPITIGATVAVGTTYILSGTAGGIAPDADAVTGWYKNTLGVATTAAIIQVQIQNSGVAVP